MGKSGDGSGLHGYVNLSIYNNACSQYLLELECLSMENELRFPRLRAYNSLFQVLSMPTRLEPQSLQASHVV